MIAGVGTGVEVNDPDDIDMQEAAQAHQQELEARQWQQELTADAGYFEWLDQLRQEVNHADYRD